jgi:hypothetical protein
MKTSPRALQFRDGDGRVLGTTWGGTTCLNPRPMSKYAAVSEDGEQEHCIPCRDCPGCREFLRRELCKALDTHFATTSEDLWLVIVECPLSSQAQLSCRLHRLSGVAFEPSFYRLGDTMFALIARGPRPRRRALSTLSGSRFTVRKVERGRGLRAWATLTWGVLTPRSQYGQNINRYYHRGLPRFERQKWIVRKRGGIKARHPWVGRGIIAVRGDVGLYRADEPTLPRMQRRTSPAPRPSSTPTSVGQIVLGMLDRNYAPAPERGLPINCRPPKAGVPASVTGFRNAPASQAEGPVAAPPGHSGRGLLPPAPTATQEPDLNEVKGRRYATSLNREPANVVAGFLALAEKARQRGG